MYIESLTNKHVKDWVKLKDKKYRDATGLFLIEGEHLIEEARKKNCIQEVISVRSSIPADFYVTDSIMKKISNQVSISDTIAVCSKLPEKEIGEKILVLDRIQDPGNLGTILRSAVAFNFDTVVLSEDTVDVYNDKVIRSSEGMLFSINILRRDITSFLEKNKEKYTILVTDVKDGENIKKLPKMKSIILVIGNEGNGVKEEIKIFQTYPIKLKMNSSCESLNAGVAASIFMYEINEASHE